MEFEMKAEEAALWIREQSRVLFCFLSQLSLNSVQHAWLILSGFQVNSVHKCNHFSGQDFVFASKISILRLQKL